MGNLRELEVRLGIVSDELEERLGYREYEISTANGVDLTPAPTVIVVDPTKLSEAQVASFTNFGKSGLPTEIYKLLVSRSVDEGNVRAHGNWNVTRDNVTASCRVLGIVTNMTRYVVYLGVVKYVS